MNETLSGKIKIKLFGAVPLFPSTLKQRRYSNTLSGIPVNRRELPKTSIVIPTRNRPADLACCLGSIMRQTIVPDEVIIVNNGKMDVRDVIRPFESITSIRYEAELVPGISRSRNLGLSKATGEIIFFLVDDIILRSNYIEEELKIFLSDKERKVGGVEGYFNRYEPQGFKRVFWPLFGLYSGRFDGMMMPNGFCRNVNSTDFPVITQIVWGVSAWRKEVFESNLFDEVNFPGYTIGEDAEFAYRVSKNWALVATPYAEYEHREGKGGRPHPFKMGVQRMHSYYKTLALNNKLGLINHLLMNWFFLGEQLRILYSFLTNSGARKKMLLRLAGQTVGMLTIPLAIASKNNLSYRFVQWLSKAED